MSRAERTATAIVALSLGAPIAYDLAVIPLNDDRRARGLVELPTISAVIHGVIDALPRPVRWGIGGVAFAACNHLFGSRWPW